MNFLDETPKKVKKIIKKTNISQNYGIVISFIDRKVNFNFIKTHNEANLKEEYISFSKEEKKIFNLIQNAKK
ncbi:MAG TPA: hypothetical protein EYG72_03050 [Candidatus Pacebacteria bacterium]|nr:hypothetical protein [Candidatus Paceibacterota bacterium]HIP33158.1 hypothetical protein [Bacteroidia bacterium]